MIKKNQNHHSSFFICKNKKDYPNLNFGIVFL
nr:MAG TPA: hypothetical protein [Microviridae sp.]DAT02436.1 MAG TPA: hypothetical protein [Microviridae sp.]